MSISEYLFWLIRVKFEPGTESPDQVNAEIGSEEEPYLVGGPGLVRDDSASHSLMEVFNSGPEPIRLMRCQLIGVGNNASGLASASGACSQGDNQCWCLYQ